MNKFMYKPKIKKKIVITSLFDMLEHATCVNSMYIDDIIYDIETDTIKIVSFDEEDSSIKNETYLSSKDLIGKTFQVYNSKEILVSGTNKISVTESSLENVYEVKFFDNLIYTEENIKSIQDKLVKAVEELIVENMLSYYSTSGIGNVSKPKTVPIELVMPSLTNLESNVNNYIYTLVAYHTPITEKYYRYFVSNFVKILSDDRFEKNQGLFDSILKADNIADTESRYNLMTVLLLEYIYFYNHDLVNGIFRSKPVILIKNSNEEIDENFYPLTFAIRKEKLIK